MRELKYRFQVEDRIQKIKVEIEEKRTHLFELEVLMGEVEGDIEELQEELDELQARLENMPLTEEELSYLNWLPAENDPNQLKLFREETA